MITNASKKLIWVAVIGTAALVAGVVGYAAMGRPRETKAAGTMPKLGAATPLQRAAADFAYPVSSGVLPPSITITHDAGKDHSRMVLTLENLPAAAEGASLQRVSLRLTSDWSGERRRADAGELSVQCRLSLVTTAAGVLAASAPPSITADGIIFQTRPISPTAPGYKSGTQPDGVHEFFAFKLDTKHLIVLSGASKAVITCGNVRVTLNQTHLKDVREFAARMDPNP